MSIVDPREEIEHEIEPGQVYTDSRNGELFELIYIDRNVYVLQVEDETHRFGKRKDFENNVGAGRYKLQPDKDSFAVTEMDAEEMLEPVPFEKLDNIGDKAASNLRKAGYETVGDVKKASDEELLDVSWVGQKGVESIREEVQ